MDFEEEFEPAEEEPPESLQKKWDREELEKALGKKREKPCPHCGQPIEEKSFFCLYCGERIFSESGFLGFLLKWLTEGKLFFIFLLLIVVWITFTLVW